MKNGCNFPTYDEFAVDEELERHDNLQKTGIKKDWFKPANVSLAKLDQIKATVYNLGLVDAHALRSTQARSTNAAGDSSFLSLKTEPPLSKLSIQKAVWGSNLSIPDMIKEAGKASSLASRPSSAKSARVLSVKKLRPQSAKDPLCPTGKLKPPLGVKGCHFELMDKSSNNATLFTAPVGWAGPPAGFHDPNKGLSQEDRNAAPPVPNTSPVPPDNDDNTNDKDNCQPLGQSKGTSSSMGIHLTLSLPNADEGDDEVDKEDTARLLQEADRHIKSNEVKDVNVIHLFTASTTGAQDNLMKKNDVMEKFKNGATISKEKSVTCGLGKTNVDGLHKEKSVTCGLGKTNMDGLHKSCRQSDRTVEDDTVPRLSLEQIQDTVTDLDLEDIGSSHAMHEVENGEDSHCLLSSKEQGLKYLGPPRHVKKMRSHPIFLEKGEIQVKQQSKLLAKPLDREVQEDTSAPNFRTGVRIKFCEEQNITVDITPRNMGRKVEKSPSKKSPSNQRSLHPDLEITSVKHQNITTGDLESGTSIPLVSVLYEDNDSEPRNINRKQNKVRGRVREKDLVTMVSQITLSDNYQDKDEAASFTDKNEGHPQDANNGGPVISSGEDNYYDYSRKINGTCKNKANANDPTLVVTKTTKTITFDRDKPTESVIRSLLDIPILKQPEKLPSAILEKDLVQPTSAKRPRSAKKKISETQKVQHPASQHVSKRDKFQVNRKSEKLNENLELEERSLSRIGFFDIDLASFPHDVEKTNDTAIKKSTAMGNRPPSGKCRPLSASAKTNKPSETTKNQANCHQVSRPRPFSASCTGERTASTADAQRANAAAKALLNEKEDTEKSHLREIRRHYSGCANSRSPQHPPHIKSAPQTHPSFILNSKKPGLETFDPDVEKECQKIQNRLACYGIDVKMDTLERALYPPSGRTLFYELSSELPQSYSSGLLSHPQVWLPEEHRKLKIAEKQLAEAELSLWRQKKKEERKAQLAEGKDCSGQKRSKKTKKKKVGKRKLLRSYSIC